MMANMGWHAALAVVASAVCYFVIFRRELVGLGQRAAAPDVDVPEEATTGGAGIALPPPVPGWFMAAHLMFMAWTVITSHYPARLGGFLFFLGFARRPLPTRAASSSRRRCLSASSSRAS